MHLFGIGIDIVEVERISSSIHAFGEKFLNRIFTEAEKEYCLSQKHPEIHFAARFASKEAIAKSFGTGIGKDLSWLDMEVLRQDSGEPLVKLHGAGKKFAEKINASEIKISLTHTKIYAVANAAVLVAGK